MAELHSEKKLNIPNGMKSMAIRPAFIGEKPNVLYATCCAPCAIYSHQGAMGNDCLISVLLCLFCWPGACIHGGLWASSDVGSNAKNLVPRVIEMKR